MLFQHSFSLFAVVFILFLPVTHCNAQWMETPAYLKTEGFHPLPTLRTGFAVGSILRETVDGGNRRVVPYYLPSELNLSPVPIFSNNTEVLPQISTSTNVGINAALRFLFSAFGLSPEVSAEIGGGSNHRVAFGSAKREVMRGPDEDRFMRAALQKGLPSPGRYHLITAVISIDSVEASSTATSSGSATAAITALQAKGGINAKIENGTLIIPQVFIPPMAAFYSYLTIRPNSGSLGGPDPSNYYLDLGLTPIVVD